MRIAVAISAAILAAAPAAASAQERQSFSGTFTTTGPGAATGFSEAIDYVNPGDPGGKPYSVQRVVLRLHPGMVIDTSVPEQCKATQEQFAQRGRDACPPGSLVGAGEVSLDTGQATATTPRVIEFVSTFFNDADQLVLYLESTNTSTPIRTASRGTAADGTYVTEVPPVPGMPPPDSFAAIKRVRLTLARVVGPGGRSYLRTPPACPASGRWTNTATFTYRDGAEQTVASPSPCAGAGDSARPTIRLAGLPAGRCAGRSFRLRVHVVDASPLRRAAVFVDGRRVRTTKRKLFAQRVRLAGRRGTGHRVTVKAVDAAGNRTRRSVRLRRC